jgi:hypothetical protein
MLGKHSPTKAVPSELSLDISLMTLIDVQTVQPHTVCWP